MTDNTAAVMRASSLSLSRVLYEMGHDPVMQMTCRDRNRLGIQSDLWVRIYWGFGTFCVLPGIIRPSAITKTPSRSTIWIPSRSCRSFKG